MNTILEKTKELDKITDRLYAARMKLKCIEKSIEEADPFSGNLESLIGEAMELRHEIEDLSVDEFVVRYEIGRITMEINKNSKVPNE